MSNGRIVVMPSKSRGIGPIDIQVARLLGEARNTIGMRLVDLDAASGVTHTQLSRMLNGERYMTVEEFVAISRALGLDPVDVLRQACEQAGITVEPAEWELAALDAVGTVEDDEAAFFNTP